LLFWELKYLVERSASVIERALLVDLTFYGFPANILKEFAQKIVKPYFNGNMDEAIKNLLEKAIAEESLVKVLHK
jgi:hypothetical protein